MSWVPWQQMVLSCLRDLSDTEQQRQTWLNMNGGDLPPPGELVCQLFDDTGLDEELEIGTAISPECDVVLRELGRKLDDIDFDQPTRMLLKDPAWHEAGSMAATAVRIMERISSDADTG